jgi:hypothetical protein
MYGLSRELSRAVQCALSAVGGGAGSSGSASVRFVLFACSTACYQLNVTVSSSFFACAFLHPVARQC